VWEIINALGHVQLLFDENLVFFSLLDLLFCCHQSLRVEIKVVEVGSAQQSYHHFDQHKSDI